MDIKNYVISALLGLVVVFGGLFFWHPAAVQQVQQKLGALAGPDIPFPYLDWGGGYTYRSTGQCYGGAVATTVATSTMFAVQNPWNATSTLTYASIYGLQGATTTDIIVGTSTTPAPAGLAVATSSLVGNVFGMFSVTAATQFNSTAGVTMGAGTGYRAPSSGTYPTSQKSIEVGPLEWIVGISTSTAVGNTNGGITAGTLGTPASCNYRFDFERL